MFIDRIDELKYLEKEYNKNQSSMVIVYGRRRLGKTSLIQQFIMKKPALYFLATQETDKENISEFKNLAGDFLNSELLKQASGLSWLNIFSEISKMDLTQRVVIVIDEFQYLCIINKAFTSIFQKIWDTTLKDKNIMVILCGSLVSMMETYTLSYNSPLYGRRTGQIRLKQIPFRYYKDFYPDFDNDKLIQFYSVTGGVPRYIEIFSQTMDLLSNIKENILTRDGFLYEEPVFLLEKEVSEIGSFFSIFKAIGAGNHKLSAIASQLQTVQASLTRYLAVLIQLDLVERQVPITEDYPEKSKKGLYFIKDNFILFWFTFIYPYRSYIEINNTAIAISNYENKFIQSHVAYVYEQICTDKLWDLSSNEIIPVKFTKVGRWWNNNHEIDIVGLNNETKEIVFCECKYSEKPVGTRVLDDLIAKSKHVDWNKKERKEYFVLFSRSGFEEALVKYAKITENVLLWSDTKKNH